MPTSSNENTIDTLAQLLEIDFSAKQTSNAPLATATVQTAAVPNEAHTPSTITATDFMPFIGEPEPAVVPSDYTPFASSDLATNGPVIGQWHWVRLTVASTCIGLFIILFASYYWAQQITSYGPPRTLWHTNLAGHEFGIDSWPVSEYNSGYLEIWYKSQDSRSYQPLFRFPGKPMKPAPRRLKPGEVLASNQFLQTQVQDKDLSKVSNSRTPVMPF